MKKIGDGRFLFLKIFFQRKCQEIGIKTVMAFDVIMQVGSFQCKDWGNPFILVPEA